MATANVTKLDYYEVLSVSRDANDQELKTAYRRSEERRVGKEC